MEHGFAKDAFGQVVRFSPHELHQITVGATRSGKTQTNYFMLGQVSGNPCVAVIGIDPSGLTLAPFEDQGQNFVANGSANVAAYVGVVEAATALIDSRTLQLRRSGVDKLQPSEVDPTVIVVLEEYAGILAVCDSYDAALKPADRIKPRVMGAVRRILTEGAKSQVFCWSVQTRPDAQLLGGLERAQYGRRITHRLDTVEAVRMLNEAATDEDVSRVLQFPVGVGLLNEPGQPYRFFRSAYLTYGEYLERVKARYVPKNFIFDGLGADAGNQAQDDARAAKAKRIGDG